MKAFHFRILLLVLSLLSLQACAAMHSAESIEAWVVDAQTGQPIEGAVVVAHWQLERKYAIPPGVVGYDPRGPLQLQILESVTDANGRFAFPAWGPLSAPPGAYLEGDDPRIIIFKSGYEYFSTGNIHPGNFDSSASSTRTSWVNGKTIKLKKFEGDLKEYARQLLDFGVDLDFAASYKNCDWKRLPRILAAAYKQKKIFEENKVFVNNLPDINYLPLQDQCGSASEFMKEYLK
jgi:hypothetical protein